MNLFMLLTCHHLEIAHFVALQAPMSRDCDPKLAFCPGSVLSNPEGVDSFFNASNSTIKKTKLTTRIPANVTDMFNSATKNSTVAGALDIQYRSWTTTSNVYYGLENKYPVGQKLYVDSLLSNEEIILVEGLIVDMKNGGIGFRNHTVPRGLEYGAIWDEDILWLEPDISCANTNLSFHVNIAGSVDSAVTETTEAFLVDDGGFANLRHGDASEGWKAPEGNQVDTRQQAEHLAWYHNVLAATYLKINKLHEIQDGINSEVGHRYRLPNATSNTAVRPPITVRSTSLLGDWIGPQSNTDYFKNNNTLVVFGMGNTTTFRNPEDSPVAYASVLFNELSDLCSGLSDDDNVARPPRFQCGALGGVPRNIDNDEDVIQFPGTQWKFPAYTCAGAMKASINTVSFSLNGPNTLIDTTVRDVTEQKYESPDDYPLWAFEYIGVLKGSDGESSGQFKIPSPLWGLVDDSYQGTPGYNFSKQPSFYLPSSWKLAWSKLGTTLQDMAASAVAPNGVLADVIAHLNFGSVGTADYDPSYTGLKSLALTSKWRGLAAQEHGYEKLLRLVWADSMANNVMMAKEAVSPGSNGKSEGTFGAQRNVQVFVRRIHYRLAFATPAIILLIGASLLVVAGILSGVFDWHLFRHLRSLPNDTSVGRVATTRSLSDKSSLARSSTSSWQKTAGATQIKLGGGDETTPTLVNDDSETKV